ncbi:MAG: TRAP transporter substrate-binding protein [Firmicutes bacterium]|jgi:tripartite ATP-independent transporter DctP family solute receptor|nr:TRAP transporter substrate-binding protein [Bacillota bacterium]
MSKRLLVVSLLCVVILLMGSLSAFAAPRLVLRAGDDSTEDYPYHQAFKAWSEAIWEASNGEIKLEVYSNAVLGYERELIEGVQMGTIDFCTSSLGPFGSFAPMIDTLNLPYLFKDVDHLVRCLDSGLAAKMNAYVEEHDPGFYTLAWICGGGRSFYTKKPVYSVADLKDQKIRVMENKVYIDLVNMMGGKAVPMAYGEVYSGLQTGVIDGAENDPGAYYTQRHYEVAPNYALDVHTIDITGLLASKKTWDNLSNSDKQILIQCLPAFIEAGRKSWAQLTVDALNALREEGVNIIEVDQEEFKEAVMPLWDEVLDRLGSDLVDFVLSVP